MEHSDRLAITRTLGGGLSYGPYASNEEKAPDAVRISLASPQKILEWSSGEVKNPETINYRTFKPERDGLFCSVIFGPEKDFECLCGKYKGVRFEGVSCEKCNVEVIKSTARRERMGHITLACPVAHIWFVKSLPSRISIVLGMMQRDVESVLYFEKYVVTEPGNQQDLGEGDLLSLLEYRDRMDILKDSPDPSFRSVIGAEGLREMLMEVDIDGEVEDLREEIKKSRAQSKIKDYSRRLRVLEQFRRNNIRPEWMILEVLPVLPPSLRPLVSLDGVRFTSSDLNDLYRRIINRNNRLQKVMELHAPEIIVNNEKRMLQEAVDALIDNGRRGKAQNAPNSKRPLKSLTDVVKGKGGRFRQNLLGKRVDFSGRTVIVVGPELKLHQCGLPKEMALELFKPWVYHLLESRGHAAHLRQARKMVDERSTEIWDCLEEAIRQHPVMLNRAPTLHRLGIQAFEPVLIEGKAIQLHPLVCTAFNADFDGDQMAVHVPLSIEARSEARILMLSSNNMLSPANGEPVILPSQDIVLGLYYLTREENGRRGEGMVFADPEEALLAYSNDQVALHAKVKVRMTPRYTNDDGEIITGPSKILDTTVGRAIMSLSMPAGINLEQFNETLKKGDLARMVNACIRNCDQRATAIFADDLMRLGFKYSTRAGISISLSDVVKAPDKEKIIDEAQREVQQIQDEYDTGIISADELNNKVSELWKHAKMKVEKSLMETLDSEVATKVDAKGKEVELKDEDGNPVLNPSSNSIFMMVESGARGSRDQLMQLAGMRGQMVKPDGSIIPTPVIASFREGLNILQYFISTHGGRKGLADTALKTANSGYLTRRLVDVAQHLVVTEEDCGTSEGITLRQVSDASGVSVSLGTRALGRVLCEPVRDVSSETELIEAGTLLDERLSEMLDEYKIDRIKVRSAVTCMTRRGMCVKCYGRDLGRGRVVQLGEAVGIIAAQSIGEPGTQLTMRTFYTGGVANTVMSDREYRSSSSGTVKFEGVRTLSNRAGQNIVVSNTGEVSVLDEHGRDQERHDIHFGATLHVEDGQKIGKGTVISRQDPLNRPEITQNKGYVRFVNIEPENLQEQADSRTGKVTRKLVEGSKTKGKKNQPEIKLVKKLHDDPAQEQEIFAGKDIPLRFVLSFGMTLLVDDGDPVEVGDVLAMAPQERSSSSDITRGLPRVVELFEARAPKMPGVLAKATGQVLFKGLLRDKEKWEIIDKNGKSHDHIVPRGMQRIIHSGDEVKKGDMMFDGEIDPLEILHLRGREALTKHLVDEVQDVYKGEAVTINDKHIEVIIHQMLQRADILDPGDSELIKGDQASIVQIEEKNEALRADGKKTIVYEEILLGITKAALRTDSVISAASFQETTKVLTEAAINCTRDKLTGLKENVIVGRLIPAGTGMVHYKVAERESALLNERSERLRQQSEESLEEGDDEEEGSKSAAA